MSIKGVVEGFYPLETTSQQIAFGSTALLSLTLLVLSCLETSGAVSMPSYSGWIVAGGSVAALAAQIALGLKDKKVGLAKESLQSVTLLVLGILQGSGALSLSQLGWGIIGTLGGSNLLFFGGSALSKQIANYRLGTSAESSKLLEAALNGEIA